jgi:hypothetical protein
MFPNEGSLSLPGGWIANPFVVAFEYAVRGGVHGGKAFSCVLEGPRIWRSSYKLLTDTGAVKVRMIFGMLLTSRSHSVQAIVSE